MLEFIVIMVLLGLVGGAVARLVLPGPDPIGLLGTIAVGIVGSFVGGFLGYVLFGHDIGEGALQPSGVIGSIIGSILVLWLWRVTHYRSRSSRGRTRTRSTRSRRYARR